MHSQSTHVLEKTVEWRRAGFICLLCFCSYYEALIDSHGNYIGWSVLMNKLNTPVSNVEPSSRNQRISVQHSRVHEVGLWTTGLFFVYVYVAFFFGNAECNYYTVEPSSRDPFVRLQSLVCTWQLY